MPNVTTQPSAIQSRLLTDVIHELMMGYRWVFYSPKGFDRAFPSANRQQVAQEAQAIGQWFDVPTYDHREIYGVFYIETIDHLFQLGEQLVAIDANALTSAYQQLTAQQQAHRQQAKKLLEKENHRAKRTKQTQRIVSIFSRSTSGETTHPLAGTQQATNAKLTSLPITLVELDHFLADSPWQRLPIEENSPMLYNSRAKEGECMVRLAWKS